MKKRNERIAWDKYVVCVVRRNNRAIADACECKWFNKSILCFFFNVVYSLNSYSYDDQPASASLHAWAMSMNMRAIEEEWKKTGQREVLKRLKLFYVHRFFPPEWNDDDDDYRLTALCHLVRTNTNCDTQSWCLYLKMWFFPNNRLFCIRLRRVDMVILPSTMATEGKRMAMT